jgi:energy-coupling factor transporter ATP-binding protein EcfA2
VVQQNNGAVPGGSAPPAAPQPDTSMQLFNMVTTDKELYFLDQMGTPFVRYQSDIGLKNSPIDSTDYQDYLRRLWRSTQDRIISSESLNKVIAELEALARIGETFSLSTRFAYSKDTDSLIYDFIDGTGDVAVINKDGVNVVHQSLLIDDTPLLRTESHQKPQDRPERSSDPTLIKDLFRDFMNIPDHSVALVCGWLGVSFMHHLTQPALYLTGEPASGKTTQLRVLRRLIDPSILELLDPPRRRQDAELQAAQNPILMYDNMPDGINAEMSEFWCRVITGGASSKRKHNENTEMVMINFKAPIGFNGINLGAAKADLLDRSIILHTLHIPRTSTKEEEAEFYPAFEKVKPNYLGAIFNGISKAMAIAPTLEVQSKGRFGDFVRWGAAFCEAVGYGSSRFLREYDENRKRQVAAALDGELLGRLVQDWLSWKNENENFIWSGTTTHLLNELNLYVDIQTDLPCRDGIPIDRNFPKSPAALTKKLRYLTTVFEEVGIFAQLRDVAAGSLWEIGFIEEVHATEKDVPEVPQVPLNNNIYGSNGSNGSSQQNLFTQ